MSQRFEAGQPCRSRNLGGRMPETVLLVGTRKGLWIGRSRRGPADWSWTGPHFDMEEVYSCLVDTRGDRPRLLVGRVARAGWARASAAPTTSARPGRRRPTAASGSPRTARPASSGSGSWRRAPEPDSCGPAPSRARCGAPSDHGADLRARARPCGTTRTARSGTPASAARPSTRSCRTPTTPTR